MASDTGSHTWEHRSLYSLATYQNGFAFRPADSRSDHGLPILRIAELNNGITARTGLFSGEAHPKHHVHDGDLLFAWSGSIGVYVYSGPPAVLNQHIFRVVAREGVDQVFLRYLLEDQVGVFKGIVEDQRTTMGHVKVADLKRLTVALPPLDLQLRIAQLLSTLDDCRDGCVSTMDTLLTLVHTECEIAVTHSSLEDEITLLSAVRLVNGGAYTKGASGTGRMVIRIKDLKSGISDTTVFNDIDVPEDKTAYPGDVLFAWSASLGVWRWVGDEAIVNQHIFKVLPNAHPVWLGWFHIRNALVEFQDIASGKATTMGHITKDHLERTRVPQLTADELQALAERVEPLWLYHLQLARQERALRELRAFLLPRLLSGELCVDDAETQVEALT